MHLPPDFRRALQALQRTPGFTAAVMLTLALGIGANAAIFSMLEQVLWRPLPYRDPEALVLVRDQTPDLRLISLSAPDLADLRRKTKTLTGIAGFAGQSLNLGGAGSAEGLQAGRVSANFFEVLGVQPALGHGFSAQEEQYGSHRAVLLSHELWHRRYAGQTSVIGSTLRMDGESWNVIGVLPKGFRFPFLSSAELFIPLAFTPQQTQDRGAHFFTALGRLRPGASAAAATRDASRIIEGTQPGLSAAAQPLKEIVVGSKRKAQLWLLMISGGLVLLIASVNVANLVLARNLARRQELAIRAAQGAGRLDLMAPLLTESLLLSVLGGFLGLGASRWITAGLLQVVSLPVGVTAEPSLRVILGMALVTLAVGLLFSWLPAWQATRGDLLPALREGAKSSASAGTHRLRGALVVGEIALATTLLVSTGLLLRSLWHLESLPLGFDPSHVIVGQIRPADSIEPARLRTFTEALVHRLTATPGVQSAAITDSLPMADAPTDLSYAVAGEAPLQEGHVQQAYLHQITPGFLQAMGIRLLEGRDFSWTEGKGSCLVSESFARRHFPGQSPLGKLVRFDEESPWLRIVGQVATTEQGIPGDTTLPHLYIPLQESEVLQVAVRTQPGLEGFDGVLRATAAALDPDLPMHRVASMESLVAKELGSVRSQGILLAAFSAVALLLALVGVYELMHVITQGRIRELGIRSALGATARQLVALMLGQGFRLVSLGLALGLAAAALLSRGLASQLQGVDRLDLATYGIVALCLCLSALVALLIPTIRAAAIPPSIALRSE